MRNRWREQERTWQGAGREGRKVDATGLGGEGAEIERTERTEYLESKLSVTYA